MKMSHYQTLYNSEVNHWWYRVRRELVHSLINDNLKNKKLSILDVGCGTGALMKELEVYGLVHGTDFSEQAVNYCKSRGIENVKQGQIESIPHSDDSFDLVLALDVLEHVPDDESALKEIYRVLKPGGVLIVFVPTFMFLWSVTDVISQHYRRYTKTDIVKKLRNNNFLIINFSYFNFLLFIPIFMSRFFIKIFKFKINSENNTGNGLVNTILYYIFHFEVYLLSVTNLPFGVSCMVVVKKE